MITLELKLKILGLNSLTNPSGVVKLWMPQKGRLFKGLSISWLVADWILDDVIYLCARVSKVRCVCVCTRANLFFLFYF